MTELSTWPTRIFIAGALALILATGCASAKGPEGSTQTLVHVVLVWLKEPGNKSHREQIINQTRLLRAIPGVGSIRVGEVARSQRPVVDDSFDVGLYMEFESREAMENYLVHPIHKQAVRNVFRPLSRKYLVYDFVDQNGDAGSAPMTDTDHDESKRQSN